MEPGNADVDDDVFVGIVAGAHDAGYSFLAALSDGTGPKQPAKNGATSWT